jgi:hypothetical protein
MSNRSCEDCKWDKKGMICLQGHVRGIKCKIADGYVPLEDCHAWEEKVKCWCEKIREIKKCPQCGKWLKEED